MVRSNAKHKCIQLVYSTIPTTEQLTMNLTVDNIMTFRYVWQWIRITDKGEEVLGPFGSVTLLYVLSITHPSQGCLNSLVYFRPSYIKYRHRDEHEFRLASICRVLNIPVPRVLLVEWWTSLFCKRKTEEADDTVGGGDATRSQKIVMEDALRGEEPPPQDAAGND